LLIYRFGEENVDTEIPTTEPETDVKLFGKLISIKTITGKDLTGVKLIWTVEAEKQESLVCIEPVWIANQTSPKSISPTIDYPLKCVS